METNKPLLIEKIKISPKRLIYLKLWGPSSHSKYGMTKSSIEIQEIKFLNENEISYSEPLRIPCNGAAALLQTLIGHYIFEGRQLDSNFKKNQDITEYPTRIINQGQIDLQKQENAGLNLESLLLIEFKGKKLSKTRILNTLQEKKGIEIENQRLTQTLESLATNSKITKEPAIHSASGTRYNLWVFPN
ncbi:MAG: hypothetical protein ACFFAU_16035 [Candidatus Hodarchaeota archaeon]